MPLRRGFWIACLVPALLSIGCVRLHGPEEIRRDLSRSAGVKLNRETGITVTRSGVWLARKVLKWSTSEDEMPLTLKGLRRVQVGVYEVEGPRSGVESPTPIELARFFDASWTPLVRVRDEGETVAVLTQAGERPGQIRAMVVVVADDEEWVLVRMLGKLENIIEEAMQLAFEEADRPDLYGKTKGDIPLSPSIAKAAPPEHRRCPGAGGWDEALF